MIPQTTQIMPFKQIMSRKIRPPQSIHNAAPTNDRPNINGDCKNCEKKGHMKRKCRNKKRDEANQKSQDSL